MTEILNEYYTFSITFNSDLKFYLNIFIISYIPFLLSLFKYFMIKKINIINIFFILIFPYSFTTAIILYNFQIKNVFLIELLLFLLSFVVYIFLTRNGQSIKKSNR